MMMIMMIMMMMMMMTMMMMIMAMMTMMMVTLSRSGFSKSSTLIGKFTLSKSRHMHKLS